MSWIADAETLAGALVGWEAQVEEREGWALVALQAPVDL